MTNNKLNVFTLFHFSQALTIAFFLSFRFLKCEIIVLRNLVQRGCGIWSRKSRGEKEG
jgi:hypothetical protein